MTKISQLISKLEELEHEIELEEKTILKNAIQELQNKLKNEDPSVLDIQNKLIDKQEKTSVLLIFKEIKEQINSTRFLQNL